MQSVHEEGEQAVGLSGAVRAGTTIAGSRTEEVWLDLHFRGAGKLNGDLTPECAAALTAMLDALGKKAGPEDDRTTSQRHHDALEEGCQCWLPSCIRL
jgi:Domain of unknown function (DUF222)